MIKTILILMFTLVVVPLAAIYFGNPLTELQVDILYKLIWLYVATSLYCFIVSELAHNYSQTDKLWSLMPIAYAWLATHWAGWNTSMIILSSIISLWGLRLTLNFVRRGGYSWKFWAGEEDYRWEVLRNDPPLNKKWVWTLFNLFFISFYQHGLILMFTLPIILLVDAPEPGLGMYLLAILGIVVVLFEAIADQQQWNFQKEKYRLKNSGAELTEPYNDGFVQSGLWSMMRHPNYAAEQAFWLVVYAFSVLATGLWINWSFTGVLLLLILFHKSAEFSENISAEKYPKYKDYQERVGRFIPKLK